MLQAGQDRHSVMVKVNDAVAWSVRIGVIAEELIVRPKVLALPDHIAAELPCKLQRGLVACVPVKVDEPSSRPHRVRGEGTERLGFGRVALFSRAKVPLVQIRHVAGGHGQALQPSHDPPADRLPETSVIQHGKGRCRAQRQAVRLLVDDLLPLPDSLVARAQVGQSLQGGVHHPIGADHAQEGFLPALLHVQPLLRAAHDAHAGHGVQELDGDAGVSGIMVHDGRVKAKGGLPVDPIIRLWVCGFDHAVDGQLAAIGQIEGGGYPRVVARSLALALRWRWRLGPDIANAACHGWHLHNLPSIFVCNAASRCIWRETWHSLSIPQEMAPSCHPIRRDRAGRWRCSIVSDTRTAPGAHAP